LFLIDEISLLARVLWNSDSIQTTSFLISSLYTSAPVLPL